MNPKYLVFIYAVVFVSCSKEWDGKIEYKEGIKILRNFGEPLVKNKIEIKKIVDIPLDKIMLDNKMIDKISNICVDAKSNIYICDYNNSRIVIFDKIGKPIGSIGQMGKGPGEFLIASFCAIDKENRKYINDPKLKRVSIFNSDNEFISSFDYKAICTDFLVINSQCILLSVLSFLTKDGLVEVYNSNGELSQTFVKKTKTTDEIHLSGNAGKLATTSKTIYYAHPFPYIIERYDSSFNLIEKIYLDKKEFTGLSKNSRYVEGRLLGSELKNSIKKISVYLNKYLLIECLVDNKFQVDIFDCDGKYLTTLKLPEGKEIGFVKDKFIYAFDRGIKNYPSIEIWELNMIN